MYAVGLANSAAFAPRAPAISARRAIVAIGAESLRTLAAQVAAGNASRPIPAVYRRHSAATAAGCVVAAPAYGVERDEAFSLGLLHDIGWPILWSVDMTLARDTAGAGVDTAESAEIEFQRLGMSHADAGAQLLGSWGFPSVITDAIASHHAPIEQLDEPMSRLLATGEALARHHPACGVGIPDERVLEELGYSGSVADRLVELTIQLTSEILGSLSSSA